MSAKSSCAPSRPGLGGPALRIELPVLVKAVVLTSPPGSIERQ
jgi:hypothetical protein